MDAAEFETLVTELETRVDRLRSLYEQYFMGIEKTIPSVAHKDVERRIQTLRREQPRNTGLRFRFQMIIQRYNMFQSYWQRVTREIEEGTYKRHIVRAKNKFGRPKGKEKAPPPEVAMPVPPEPGRTASGSYVLDLDAELEEVPLEPIAPAPAPAVARPAIVIPTQNKPLWRKAIPKAAEPAAAEPPAAKVAPPPAAPARPAPVPAPAPKPEKKPGDVSDDRLRQLYSQYVQTKRAQNESTAKVTFDDLSKTIRESSAKLREKHAGKSIDFEVAVRDGKTILKPVVK